MIVNYRHPESIQHKLNSARFAFYLTGSRFFGGFTPTSDWDYFVQDTMEVRTFLLDLGFRRVDDMDEPMVKYDDATIVDVYRYNDYDIQLVHNADFKSEVQNFLLVSSNMRAIPKSARKYVWNLALKFVSLHRNTFD